MSPHLDEQADESTHIAEGRGRKIRQGKIILGIYGLELLDEGLNVSGNGKAIFPLFTKEK
jgi:hypothetical protein